jgi:hypothetical protein
MTEDWPARIEREVNRQLGGDATVGDIVDLMLRLGWRPPLLTKRARGGWGGEQIAKDALGEEEEAERRAAAWESGHLKAAGKAT